MQYVMCDVRCVICDLWCTRLDLETMSQEETNNNQYRDFQGFLV